MSNKKEVIVYTYRYIWKNKDSKKDFYNVKYVTGSALEHNSFMNHIRQNQDIVSCSRIYVSEVNVSLTEQHEIVKKEVK